VELLSKNMKILMLLMIWISWLLRLKLQVLQK